MVYSKYSVTTIIVSVILPLLAGLIVAARFQSRRIKSVSLSMDDFLILVALIIVIGEGILCIWGSVNGGIGAYVPDLSPEVSKEFLKSLLAVILIHLTVLAIIKVSILLFYKRIFVNRGFAIIANSTIGFVVCWWISFFVGAFFVTTPISEFWSNPVVKDNYDWAAFIIALGALDIAVDLFILCLPIPVIKTLHMQTRRKVQLLGIFWLGLFCVISAAVRLYYVVSFDNIGGAASPEFTKVVDNNFIWATIEPCTSIIAACLPTLGPLLQTWRAPESIVNSVRSVLSIHSAGSASRTNAATLKAKQDSEHSQSSLDKRAWIALDSHEAFATIGSASEDVELANLTNVGRQHESHIRVDKTFATQHAPK